LIPNVKPAPFVIEKAPASSWLVVAAYEQRGFAWTGEPVQQQ